MANMTFPRTMTGGLLDGKYIESSVQYSREYKARKAELGIRGSVHKWIRNHPDEARAAGLVYKGNGLKRNPKSKKTSQPKGIGGTYRVEVHMGEQQHMLIEGTIKPGTDVVDALLSALTKLPVS